MSGRLAQIEANAAPGRLDRALVAVVRQEFGAPVSAIIGFAEILLEEARRRGQDDLAADFERIRAAGIELRDLLARLLDPKARAAATHEDFAAFQTQLRLDLRTPLNAVKGYGEMMMEEAAERGHTEFAADITKLLGAADHLLGQIDAVVDLGIAGAGAGGGRRPAVVASRDLVRRVIDSVEPLARAEIGAHTASSRILVVDDTAFTGDLLSRQLSREGHSVTEARSGRAALDCMQAQGFDLVLLDLMMPGMNGFEVLCRLKSDPSLRNVPVIVISALDEFDTIIRCIEAGAEDYLPRPFNPVLLRARINASLEKKRLRDREQQIAEELRVEKENSEALLLNTLPKSIVTRLQQGEAEIADLFTDVSILFLDIVGFTEQASHFPPQRVLDLLNALFIEFDRLAVGFGLEKIKTIGDAYMVAGGLPEPRSDHAVAIADMALGMVDVAETLRWPTGERLAVRLGINSGPAIAGIIGRNKFIYDVWGDTVNTASRMETAGVPYRIHISAATHALVRDSFACDYRGMIEIKGKGLMETYFLGPRLAR
jgi:class 3 adenylate cyclase/signal transduction histidine kinase